MQGIAGLLGETPVFSKFDKWSLQYMAGLAERKEYKAGEWLFREFAPREWFGVIERGDVRIVRGPDDHHPARSARKRVSFQKASCSAIIIIHGRLYPGEQSSPVFREQWKAERTA